MEASTVLTRRDGEILGYQRGAVRRRLGADFQKVGTRYEAVRNKYKALHQKKLGDESRDNKTVINISSRTLTKTEETIIWEGLKSVITSKHTPIVYIMGANQRSTSVDNKTVINMSSCT